MIGPISNPVIDEDGLKPTINYLELHDLQYCDYREYPERQTLQGQSIELRFSKKDKGHVLEVLSNEIAIKFNKVSKDLTGLPRYFSETPEQPAILTSLRILTDKLEISFWEKIGGNMLQWISQYDIPLKKEYGSTAPSSPQPPNYRRESVFA